MTAVPSVRISQNGIIVTSGKPGRTISLLVSVPARGRQVAYSRKRGLSARRACTLFRVARSALAYASRRAARDAPVIDRRKALSAQYPRYGYRRIRIFLGRDGHRISVGRAYRLWQAAGPRKRAAAARPRPQAPSGPNQVWSYDFVFDRCANGQQLKCLTVADEFTVRSSCRRRCCRGSSGKGSARR
jgi:putative transposase